MVRLLRYGASKCFRFLQGQRPLSRSLSSTPQLDISGLYPPIATPFNEDESVAYDKLTENLHKWNEIPFKGLQLCLLDLPVSCISILDVNTCLYEKGVCNSVCGRDRWRGIFIVTQY